MLNVAYVTKWAPCINANAANVIYRPEGLIDSNYFDKCKIEVFGSTNLNKDNGFWADDSVIGTGKSVYFENNIIDRGNIASVLSDSTAAGSFVIRYNNLIGGNAMTHSIQGPSHRATKSWEYYGNNWSFPDPTFYNIAFLRGGTGLFFDNTVTGPRSSYTIDIDNVRSFLIGKGGANPPPPTNDSGDCDGTSLWDGNIESNGWPCRDQIGRGPDIGTDNSIIGKSTSGSPAYFWNNQFGSNNVNVNIANGVEAWIKSNRDYYEEEITFDGTSGVGCGIFSEMNLIIICNEGVGYWVTDQSCSDMTGLVGANPTEPINGTLYKCTSTDNWEPYYRPYIYPHPLAVAPFGTEICGEGTINSSCWCEGLKQSGSCDHGYYTSNNQTCSPLDLDCSGDINIDDLTELRTLWGQTGKADLNQDNITNASDFAIMMRQWSE